MAVEGWSFVTIRYIILYFSAFLRCAVCPKQSSVRCLRTQALILSPWKQAAYNMNIPKSTSVGLLSNSNSSIFSCTQTRTLSPLVQTCRNITIVSRLGKRKSCKSVLKRFRRVKGGYLKRWRSGMVHKQRKKSSWRKFRLRGSVLVKNKTQLKTLNKMMYKH